VSIVLLGTPDRGKNSSSVVGLNETRYRRCAADASRWSDRVGRKAGALHDPLEPRGASKKVGKWINYLRAFWKNEQEIQPQPTLS
jgi:hypothetical protein